MATERKIGVRKQFQPTSGGTRRTRRTVLISILALLGSLCPASAFPLSTKSRRGVHYSASPMLMYTHDVSRMNSFTSTRLDMAKVSEKEAMTGIDKVVNALRGDKTAKEELGNLVKVNNILGYGSPSQGSLAVRFNASFQKGGFGLSSVPLPFGLGQTNESEGRGTMVGQVKASIDIQSGKVTSCSVFRDLGYGRAFNLKV